MTTELVYDPQTKMMIKDKIYSFLYQPVRDQFKQRLDTIIIKNSILHKNDQTWLNYRGEDYCIDEKSVRPRPVNRLHPELVPVMNNYLEDLKKLNDVEIPYVLGFITRVLNSSNSLQDYFRIFPESVHKPIRDLMGSCAYQNTTLTDDTVQLIIKESQVPIELMKRRMVLNLIM